MEFRNATICQLPKRASDIAKRIQFGLFVHQTLCILLCARNSNEMSRNCMESDFMEFVGKLSWILKCNITYCRPRTSLSIHFFPSQTTISSSRPQFATVTARNTGILDMDNLSSFNRR